MADLVERLRQKLPGIQSPAMRGDNLVITLASFFEPHIDSDEMDDSETWKRGAVDAANEVLDAIHAHYADRIAALEAEASKGERWQQIETAPKNRKILAGYHNPLGNWRTITACYHTHLPWSDEENPEDGSEYAPEGWYEESDTAETIYRTRDDPTHWMPLPAPPQDNREG